MSGVKELSNKIGCLPVRPGYPGGDNVAIALASYFSGHEARPEDDPVDTECGWGVWVVRQTNIALASIAAAFSDKE